MKLRYPFLAFVLISGAVAALLLALGGGGRQSGIPAPILSRDRVALVEVSGVITSSLDVSGGSVSSQTIIRSLEKYGEDSTVQALILRVNSPGGTVVSAQEIYEALLRLRRVKPVVVSMADIAASGGYYIACAADHVIANPGTLTGSIGVIMEFPNFSGLFGKLGVSTNTIKSGRFKDSGSAFRPMAEAERAVLQEMLDDVHEQFVEVVSEGRRKSREEVLPLADGRIFSGRQALEYGMVDSLGDLEEALAKAAELAGIEGRPEVVRERRKRRLWDLLEVRLSALFPQTSPFSEASPLLYLWR